MPGEVKIPRIVNRGLPPRVLEHGALKVVGHDAGGNPAERDEGVLVAFAPGECASRIGVTPFITRKS
jgi:hypothetical protein